MFLNVLKLANSSGSYNVVPREDMLTTIYSGNYVLSESPISTDSAVIKSKIDGVELSDKVFTISNDIKSLLRWYDIDKYSFPYLYIYFSLTYVGTKIPITDTESSGESTSYGTGFIVPLHREGKCKFIGSIDITPYLTCYIELLPITLTTELNMYFISRCLTDKLGEVKYNHIVSRVDKVNLVKILCPNTTVVE